MKTGLGLVLAASALLLGRACASGEEGRAAELPLDVRLGPGEVRAGVVTRASELLGGPTARGRVGDLKLYNDRVAVIVAQPGDARGYHPYGGTILDADRVRAEGEPGRSNFGEVIVGLDLSVLRADAVSVVSDGRDGREARVRVRGEPDVMPLFDSLLSQLFVPERYELDWEVDYVLEPGAEVLRIEHTVFNRGRELAEFGLPLAAFLFGDGADLYLDAYGFSVPSRNATGRYFGAVAPEVSYLYGRPDERVGILVVQSGVTISRLGEAFSLRPRDRTSFVHHLVVGDGDLSRTQASWREAAGEAQGALVRGHVRDPAGRGVAGARVHASRLDAPAAERDHTSRTRSGADGAFELEIEPGRHQLVASTDARLVGAPLTVEVASAPIEGLELAIGQPGEVVYSIRDPEGRDLPAKLTVIRLEEVGELLPERFGEPGAQAGAFVTVFAERGMGSFEVPPGRYRAYVSRGNEYEIHEAELEVVAGEERFLGAVLERSVATPGWQKSDTHIHAQLSPDSPDLYPFKVRAMVTEGLELPVSTEHEAIGDFNPAIRELGLEAWMQGIVGSEITTFTYGHFNAFPLVPQPDRPGNGRIEWYRLSPAETFAAIRANPGDPFIQVNHPRAASIGGYFSAMGFDRTTLESRRPDEMSFDFEGIEVMNGCGNGTLAQEPIQDWFAFLNRGIHKVGTASTDNHKAMQGGLGYPVTYVRLSTDEPAEAGVDEVRKAFREGRLVLSCGPFLEVRVGSAEVGDLVRLQGDLVQLEVRVAAPRWMDVDLLEVVLNGEVVKVEHLPVADGVERFAGTVTASVAPGRDAWVAVAVRGDGRHGVWAHRRPSFALTNPIFLDGDGDGAWRMR